MTWAPTHVALEAFLVWVGMGKKNRAFFKKRRWVFALLSLTALLPDLDTFIYIHRTYFHSIFWPIILIVGVLIWMIIRKYIQKKPLTDKLQLLSKSLIIVGAFILLHDILDLTTGPVLLFYPIDNRLYNLEVLMVWDLDFPLLIRGLNFEWTSISLNEGIETFFLNLTPQERIDYFGSEFIFIPISDFPLHALIFIAWLVFFPILSIIELLEKREKPSNFFKNIQKFKSPLLGLGVVLLSFGFILGPAFGLQRTEPQEFSSDIYFNDEEVNYAIVQKFELDKDDSITVQSNFAGNNSQTTLYTILSNEEDFTSLIDTLEGVFDDYNNATLNYTELVSNYQMNVDNFATNSIDYFSVIQNSSQKINYVFPEQKTVYTMNILADWNSSIDFEVQTQITSTLNIKRSIEFYTGIGIGTIGLGMVVFSIVKSVLDRKEEENSTNNFQDESEKSDNVKN